MHSDVAIVAKYQRNRLPRGPISRNCPLFQRTSGVFVLFYHSISVKSEDVIKSHLFHFVWPKTRSVLLNFLFLVSCIPSTLRPPNFPSQYKDHTALLKTHPTSYGRPSDSVSPTSLRHYRVHWKFSLLSRYDLSVTDCQVQSRSFIQESSFSIGDFATLLYCTFEGFSLFASFLCTLLKPYRSSCFFDIDANVTYLLEDN